MAKDGKGSETDAVAMVAEPGYEEAAATVLKYYPARTLAALRELVRASGVRIPSASLATIVDNAHLRQEEQEKWGADPSQEKAPLTPYVNRIVAKDPSTMSGEERIKHMMEDGVLSFTEQLLDEALEKEEEARKERNMGKVSAYDGDSIADLLSGSDNKAALIANPDQYLTRDQFKQELHEILQEVVPHMKMALKDEPLKLSEDVELATKYIQEMATRTEVVPQTVEKAALTNKNVEAWQKLNPDIKHCWAYENQKTIMVVSWKDGKYNAECVQKGEGSLTLDIPRSGADGLAMDKLTFNSNGELTTVVSTNRGESQIDPQLIEKHKALFKPKDVEKAIEALKQVEKQVELTQPEATQATSQEQIALQQRENDNGLGKKSARGDEEVGQGPVAQPHEHAAIETRNQHLAVEGEGYEQKVAAPVPKVEPLTAAGAKGKGEPAKEPLTPAVPAQIKTEAEPVIGQLRQAGVTVDTPHHDQENHSPNVPTVADVQLPSNVAAVAKHSQGIDRNPPKLDVKSRYKDLKPEAEKEGDSPPASPRSPSSPRLLDTTGLPPPPADDHKGWRR